VTFAGRLARVFAPVLLGVVLAAPAFADSLPTGPQEGIALRGAPKYAPGFQHFDYVNADAPKGGDLHLSAIGTFDTVNPFTLKGVQAEGASAVFETLMASSLDEAMSEYGLIAESVTVAPDRTWVSYKLRPEAKFSDGSAITPEDVIFSFEILRDKGSPYFGSYYRDVTKAEKTGPHEVKFTFKDGTNTELPLIMGQLPVLSKKDWAGKDFAATTLAPILGSGPYKIDRLTQGRTIGLVRDKNWWGKDLSVNKGRYNFDHIIYDYYSDAGVATEAFFAGRYDFRLENIAKSWALDYNTPAVQQGLIIKQELKNELPSGMQAFIMNMRRPLFQDRRVREALNDAFDFEWENKQYAYGAYTRTQSFFENSELAESGVPAGDELKLLEPFRDQLPPDLFTKPFALPKTDGSGNVRDNLHKAKELLAAAGWVMKDGKLVNAKGEPFTFEIIEDEPAFERWTEPFIGNLKLLGIDAKFRSVDTSQFQNRLNDFNFDMTVAVFPESLSPGNEQFDYWGSSKVDVKGSRNLIGIKSPVVDALIDKLIHSGSREDLVTATHALDRVLQWNYYVVPHWHIGTYRIAYWDKFAQPRIAPKYGLAVNDTWWVDTSKIGRIDAAQKR
jgi:microcin C transport system substrate-binding protein